MLQICLVYGGFAAEKKFRKRSSDTHDGWGFTKSLSKCIIYHRDVYSWWTSSVFLQAYYSNCLNGGVSLQQCGNSLRKRLGGPEHAQEAGSGGVTFMRSKKFQCNTVFPSLIIEREDWVWVENLTAYCMYVCSVSCMHVRTHRKVNKGLLCNNNSIVKFYNESHSKSIGNKGISVNF